MEMVEEGQSQVQFAPELMKLQEIVVTEEADRIGSLPDNVLVEILSRLPSTEEAIRTGTLSKRWEHLWTLIPVLRFRQIRDNQPLSEFVSLVDKTLTQCRQLKLKSFVLISEYDVQFESQFNNWIRYAISCNVELLGISIRNCRAQLFDQNFFTTSCFTDLRFLACQLNPIGAISWKNLRFLRISYVNVEEHLIENILSGSPQLETLVFDSCYGFCLLNITSKSLKNLVLAGYRNSKLYDEVGDIIEINAPNILSLTIVEEMQMQKLLLLNVSSLVEANLDYVLLNSFKRIPKEVKEETLKGIMLNLHHVKELKTGSYCSKVLSRLEAKGFTFPSNMKSLDACFHWSDRFG